MHARIPQPCQYASILRVHTAHSGEGENVAQFSRRGVVAGALGAAGVAALGITAGVALRPAPGQGGVSTLAAPTIEPLARSIFAPYVGHPFTAESEAGRYELLLARIEDLAELRRPEDEQRFSLLFTAHGEEPPAGIYSLSSQGAKPATLFISPVGAEGQRYLESIVDQSA